MRRRSLPLVLLLLPGCPRSTPPTEAPQPAPTTDAAEPAPAALPQGPLRYRGEVALPVGGPLEFFVQLQPGDAGYTGTITIPLQGAFDAPLGEIEVSDDTLAFSLVRAGARWSATLAPDGQARHCALEQRGMRLPCTLEPIDEATLAAVSAPPRPQTPAPPFPYDVLEQGYDNPSDGVHLAGTLTVPEGPGPFPAALLITGSGAQDRDESLLGHKPFWVLADHLTRRGIAVLRVDDRGMGGSTGDLDLATSDALARDVAAGVGHLRRQDRIDPTRVGVIGHSEGGLLGPRVAAGDPSIAFVVMLAGPGVPGHEVLREQAAAILRAKGFPAATVELARHQQAKANQILLDTEDLQVARERLRELLGDNDEIARMVTPWFHSFVRYDPAPALKKLRCPVLVLNGELDLQVLPDQNLPAIEEALAGNRKRTTVHRLPGLNHLFQHAKTGMPDEYGTIEETMAPEVLDLVADWVVAQTSAQGKAKANTGKKTGKGKKTE
ncbi:MAG: alpha/beta fold hydrolase [Myxococcales bacterium]|nr:alpha/beta fold hydrolase [Myxococcales bacterium]